MKFPYPIFTLLLVVGCTQIPNHNDNSVINKEASIGELFKLHIGESVRVLDANIEITLQDANNYLCPEDVYCVSAGNFDANVIIKDLETGETKEKTFSSFTDAHFDYTVFNEFIVSPVEWEPEKRFVGALIEKSSYQITFIVEQGITFDKQFIIEFGDRVPLGDGSIRLSLDDIVIKKNENLESKEPKSEATLHFKISKDTKQYSGQVKYLSQEATAGKLYAESGEYNIFLKELIGKQPYYHRFDRYKDEVTDPTQYRARIWVVQR